jgi:hypothetical protein
MKRTFLLLSLALLFTAPAAVAQFNKGRWLADGSMSTTSRKNEYYDGTNKSPSSSYSVSFAPSVGYFFVDRLAGGLVLSVGTTKANDETFDPLAGQLVDVTRTSNSVSVGPFIRYYLPMAIFFHGSASFGSLSAKSDAAFENQDQKATLFNWSLGVGYAWFLNDYVAVEPSVGYLNSNVEYKESESGWKSSALALSVGLAIYLGERK